MNNSLLRKIVFVIPSLNPDDKMPQYVKELIDEGASNILVVDDGSKKELKYHFNKIKEYKEVIVLEHKVNKGKGRALKTAFEYILNNMVDIKAVVTADADGQHATGDTIQTGLKVIETNEVVFGTRNFDEDIVPTRSRFGNKTTTAVFKFLYGKKVNDTQTGLRGLPIDFLNDCLSIEGERFEYEIGMLIKIVEQKREIVELPIKTIYYDSNRETHFDTFIDSYKVYKIMCGQFVKFAVVGILSFVIDIIIYTLLFNLAFNNKEYRVAILLSTVLARIISSLFNFFMNKEKVFESNNKTNKTMIKYYILAVLQMFVSWLLVSVIFSKISANTSIIKIFVDFVLFLISFQIQKRFIFNKN